MPVRLSCRGMGKGNPAGLAPYGAWRSPITAHMVAAGQVGVSEPHPEPGALYWLELRPSEGGRSVLVPATHRYADGRLTPDGRWFVCVRERHERGEPANELVATPADGSGDPRIIASGHDFFSNPRPSPDGRRLAWLSWDHPRMPWDGCELWVAELSADGALGQPRLVAGGPGESIFQPDWSPEGVLHFVSDRTGWWNLYRHVEGRVEAVAPREEEFGAP